MDERGRGGGFRSGDPAREERTDHPREHVAAARGGEAFVAGGHEIRGPVGPGNDRGRPLAEDHAPAAPGELARCGNPVGGVCIPAEHRELAVVRRENRGGRAREESPVPSPRVDRRRDCVTVDNGGKRGPDEHLPHLKRNVVAAPDPRPDHETREPALVGRDETRPVLRRQRPVHDLGGELRPVTVTRRQVHDARSGAHGGGAHERGGAVHPFAAGENPDGM